MTSTWSWATGAVWGGGGTTVEAAKKSTETRMPRWRRAVTLTYTVAPFPSDYEAIFANVLLLHSDKARVERAQRGGRQQFLDNMYRGFKGLQYSSMLSARQRFFEEHFSRQIDVVHGEEPRLLCSAFCELLTFTGRRRGTLFVTDSALYFTTSTPSEQGGGGGSSEESTAVDGGEGKLIRAMQSSEAGAEDDDDDDDTSSSSSSSGNCEERCGNEDDDNKIRRSSQDVGVRRALRRAMRSTRRNLRDGIAGRQRMEQIRERIAFTEVASILPSIALAAQPRCAADEATSEGNSKQGASACEMDYVCGVPCPYVLPTALQLFTVGPRQIFQFVQLSNVCIAAPETTGRPTAAAAPLLECNGGGDVFTAAEYKLAVDLPAALDVLKLSEALMRIWRRRLATTCRPLLHPDVTYAAPH